MEFNRNLFHKVWISKNVRCNMIKNISKLVFKSRQEVTNNGLLSIVNH